MSRLGRGSRAWHTRAAVRRLVRTALISLPVCLSLLGCPEPEPSTDEAETETGEPPSCLDTDPAGEDIVISNNADLEEAMLGECVPGKILISGGTITSIAAMSSVREVGKLEIRFNSQLDSLAGLEQLERVDELVIVGNPLIAALPEFASLTTLGRLNVDNNGALTSLGSFSALTSAGSISVGNNPMLPALDGFGTLETLDGNLTLDGNQLFVDFSTLTSLALINGDLSIQDNPELQTIDMPVLTTVGGGVEIISNPTLSECIVADFVALLDIGGPVLTSNNQADACG